MGVGFLYTDVVRVLLDVREKRCPGEVLNRHLGIFCGELDVGVNRADVLEEMVTMFRLLDDEGVIRIPKPEPGWMGEQS